MTTAPLLVLLWVTSQSPADGGVEEDVELPSGSTVVTASRLERDPADEARATTVVSREDLTRSGARSTPEALLESEGIFLQRTNHGGGAPIIRGLYGGQILLLVDGVRINNSTVRAGPNQFLNTVDPFTVEQLEVLRGPGSVLYGSDALGGVVQVRTYWPRFRSELTPSAELRTRFTGADLGLQGHLRAGVSLKDSAISAAFTARDFNDLRGGARVGVQRYSAYEEGDATFKVRQRLPFATILSAQYQAVRQSNAPRQDRSVPGDYRRFTEQFRDLLHLGLLRREATGPFSRVALDLSLHRQGDVTERFRISRDQIGRDALSTWTTGGRLEATLPVSAIGLMVMGADSYVDASSSEFVQRSITEPVTSEALPEEARYPGNPAAQAHGLFAMLSTDERRPFTWHAGARAQLNLTHLPEDPRLNILFAGTADPPPVLPATDLVNFGWAAETGARYRLPSGLQASLNLGSAFRAPNVDDLTRLGAEGPGFLVPGRALDAEQSYTAELGVGLVRSWIAANAWYAYTALSGLIGKFPTTVDGETHTPDGLPYLRRINSDSAQVHAVEARVRWAPLEELEVVGHGTWTLGVQRRRELIGSGEALIEEPISRIPPVNGVLEVTWSPRDWLFLQGVARGALRQDALSESDRLDIRMCPETFACEGTPPFAVFHLRAGTTLLEDRLTATVSVLNLLDATYRTHGSGIDEPGRSVTVSLEGKL